MDKIFSSANALLKNKYFWIVILGLLAIILLKRNWYKIKNVFKPRVIDTDLDSAGNVYTLSDTRKAYIHTIGTDLRKDLVGGFSVHDKALYQKALDLRDAELMELSTWYRKAYGVSLYADISADFFIFESWGDELKDKLTKIGEAK